MRNKVYLLLGANEGNRRENILKALRLIELRCGGIAVQSAIYETDAWGVKEQTSFLNQAALLETALKPEGLLVNLKTIEKECGRVEIMKWGPRIIDIDILFYNSEIIEMPDLKIPHPFIQDRRFTLVPLNEIAGEFIHPVLNKTVRMLLEECKDNSLAKAV